MSARMVALDTPARRVVIYPPFVWHYLTLDPAPDHVLAAPSFSLEFLSRSLLNGILRHSDHIAEAATSVGSLPGSPEPLLLLRPDAILAGAQNAAPLEQAGLPVLEMRNTDRFDDWRLAAAMSGQTERYQRLLDMHDRLIGELQVQLTSIAARAQPTVMYAYTWRGMDRMGAANSARTPGSRLKMIGATNAFATAQGFFSVEQLLRVNPDVIFLECCEPGESVESIYGAPALQSLSAVRNRRVYRRPIGGSRMDGLVEEPLLLRWMAELIWPEVMPKNLRRELRTIYTDVYGVSLGDAAIDRTLFVSENSQSANYRRFERDGSSS